MGVHKEYNEFTGKWLLIGWGVHWAFDTEKEADDNFQRAQEKCFNALEARRILHDLLTSYF